MKRKWLLLNFGFLFVLLLSFCIFGAWIWFGNLEESVSGVGQLLPNTKLRRVISPVSGTISKLLVEENSVVKAGQILMIIDPEVTTIQQKALLDELNLLQSQALALQAAYEGLGRTNINTIDNSWLMATRSNVETELHQANLQIEKSEHLYQEALNKRTHLNKLLKSQNNLLEQTKGLVDEGGLSLKDLQSYEQQVMSTEKELSELGENIEARKIDLAQAKERPRSIKSEYDKDILERLTQYHQRLASLNGELAKTQVLVKQEVIRSPIDGIVNEQAVNGVGEIVQSSNMLLSLVPINAPLTAEVKVSNRDLAFIHIGQKAALRLEALPYQQFGRLFGEITSISPSSVIDKEGQPFFIVRIKPDKSYLVKDEKKFPLKSGMTLSVDIITKEKNIFSLITEPFLHHVDKAFRDPSTR